MRRPSEFPSGRPRFRLDKSGIAAVEFALILPLILIAYLGAFDVSQEIMASSKVAKASGTVSELVAAQTAGTQLPAATVSGILGAAQAILSPFATANLTITVSGINLKLKTDGTCCDATVNWSYTKGGTLRPCVVLLRQTPSDANPAPDAIPQALASPSSQSTMNQAMVIVSDTTYAYAPLGSRFDLLLPAVLSKTTFSYPRAGGQVLMQAPSSPPAGESGKVC